MTDVQQQSNLKWPRKSRNASRKEHKRLEVIPLATAITAIGAVAAAGIAVWSVHVTTQATIASQQQQLLTISTSIVQQLASEPATLRQAIAGLTGSARATAGDAAGAAFTAQLTAEGQAAQGVISALHGNGVTGIEYIDVGRALAVSGDDGSALAYYKDAVLAPPHALLTVATALRFAGSLEYILGHADAGHGDMMSSISILRAPQPYITQFTLYSNTLQSFYDDAQHLLNIKGGCGIANADMIAAKPLLAAIGGIAQTGPPVPMLYTTDQSLYQKHCTVSGS
jgi:hypothetical protein